MSRSAHSHPDNRISIHLLGTPAVRWVGETLSIPRRHVRGLLYHLAAQRAPSPRENLCLLFWPDIPEANAYRNLTRALTHLRRAIPIPAVLMTAKETVQLVELQLWCDVFEFRRLTEEGAGIDNVERAVDLYRGPFLDGFYLPGCMEFEHWMSQECIALEKIYLDALSRLVEAKAARQEYTSAILYAQRYL
jgi:DNA-binding SARP family transcriptional activator